MRPRHASAQLIAALIALLLNTFVPTLHALVHASALLPGLSSRQAASAPGNSQDAPARPSKEDGCPLGQALPSVGPALAASSAAALVLAPVITAAAAPPAPLRDGIPSPRPASRGPPAIEA